MTTCFRLTLFLTLTTLAIGLTEGRRTAHAVVPAACPMYECKTIHAVWTGEKLTIAAHFVPTTQVNSSHAWENLFTSSSVEKSPPARSGNVDVWAYSACSPQCGKDGAGKWQAPQEVGRAGTRFEPILLENSPRFACKSNNGLEGPKIANPTNKNKDGNTPPGVTDDP